MFNFYLSQVGPGKEKGLHSKEIILSSSIYIQHEKRTTGGLDSSIVEPKGISWAC